MSTTGQACSPRRLVDGCRETELTFDAPSFGGGLRTRVDARYLPLAELLNSFLAAGLRLGRFLEDGERPLPGMLAVRTGRA